MIESCAFALECDPAKAGLEPWRVKRPHQSNCVDSFAPAQSASGPPSMSRPPGSLHSHPGLVTRKSCRAGRFKCGSCGGRGGIRTHGEFNPTLDFESSALNRTQPPFP
jgi:hypothetical protein